MSADSAVICGKIGGTGSVYQHLARPSPHHAIGGRDGMAPPKLTVEQKFWPKVDKSGDCWVWTSTLVKGYGTLALYEKRKRFRRILAHRISYELAHGAIPDGLCVLHRCDNPPCVNPAHLFLGTRADNNADKAAKGRSKPSPASIQRRRRLTGAQVREIRSRLANGESGRSIARCLDIHFDTVGSIKRGESWARFV